MDYETGIRIDALERAVDELAKKVFPEEYKEQEAKRKQEEKDKAKAIKEV